MSSLIAREVILTLQRTAGLLDLPGVAPAAIEHLKTMQGLAKEISKLVHSQSNAKRLEGPDLWNSLAHAIVGIARKKRGARLTAKDLKQLVENHCPEPDMAFWLEQYPPQVVGLLRSVPEVRKLIKPHGVLFWEEEQDGEFRIVDSRWLDAHADIRRWVLTEWKGGRRCRFCAIRENPMVNALLAVDVQRRNGVTMIGNTVVLQAGGALTHDVCREYWIEWCAIAAKYSSPAQAQAADNAAGRESRWEAVGKPAALEAPLK